MILADTSVWVDHLRNGNPVLERLLGEAQVIIHPYVIGEIALGSLKDRPVLLGLLNHMPQIKQATHDEVMLMIERQMLYSRGIGYVDIHLLASCLLDPYVRLWTFDRRLNDISKSLSVAWNAR